VSVPGYALSNFAVLALPEVLRVNLGKAASLVSAYSVCYPFVRTGMTDEYADNPKVFGRWQPRMLEPYEAASTFMELLAKPAEETEGGIFELLVEGTAEDIELIWQRVRLVPQIEKL
jgi:hypothetical protein